MLTRLSKDVLNNEYFINLFLKAEEISALIFFQVNESIIIDLTEKEKFDLLRFADILSFSEEAEEKNKAYKIISILFNSMKDDPRFKVISTAVLSKLGNFPALDFLNNGFKYDETLPLERELQKEIKKNIQKSPKNGIIFTDSQYDIFENLKNNNHFSFSGPTSFGKSFIIESFIFHLLGMSSSVSSIVVLVPTRALINQTSLKLKKDLEPIKDCKVLTHPVISDFLVRDYKKFVFVFTPERLITYLSEGNSIDYLFVDEAHKIISLKDTRSPLYYHAIIQAERKSVKLYFFSPMIPNPEIFLQLFEKSTEESVVVKEYLVSQNKYYIDLVEKKNYVIFDDLTQKEIMVRHSINNLFELLLKYGNNEKNIIYCNTIHDTINYALDFSKNLEFKQDERIEEVIKLIEEFLHKRYYLIDCLRKGVAFHFGKLPHIIRLKIEELFRDKVIDYIFCTSTLLEGVNLPAKNIFILNNCIGLSKFTGIDFWNLAGRAGRLTKELSGNIICVRAEENKWKGKNNSEMILSNFKIKPGVSPISSSSGKIFVKMRESLSGKVFTKKDGSQNERDIWNHYANIALIHEKIGEESILKSNFIKSDDNSKELLRAKSKEVKVPEKILSISSSIRSIYQSNIHSNKNLLNSPLPNVVDHEVALKYLNLLYDEYNWEEEESGGQHPLIKVGRRGKDPRNVLKYYASLMSSWINSDPISKIVLIAIQHFKKTGVIWVVNREEYFDERNQLHINTIINDLIADIENILRFKLEKYFNNYYLLLKDRVGDDKTGPNWAEYLEYGTTNRKVIELQNIGIPRQLAKHLLDKMDDCLEFNGDIFMGIDKEKILSRLSKNSVEYEEFIEFC